jgi:hypothetical protein
MTQTIPTSPPIPKAPSDATFKDGDDFLGSPGLTSLAERIQQQYPLKFGHLRDFTLVYFWKRRGGKRAGQPVGGACQKTSGALRHTSGADFIIWIAADNCREASDHELTALVFHELRHAGFRTQKVTDEDGEENEIVRPAIWGHDWEGFRDEIEEYGLWSDQAKLVAPAFMQLSLFDGEGGKS